MTTSTTKESFRLKTPCKTCPFRRSSERGATGGSNPLVFVGQTEGPFFIPCHSQPGYRQEDKTAFHKPHCAGAAMYRDAVGSWSRMPPELHVLDHDPTLVFSSHSEFLAHHLEVSETSATVWLNAMFTPAKLMTFEMFRANTGSSFEELLRATGAEWWPGMEEFNPKAS